ncbi:MAG: NAD-dependent epimerase/dehydratase family protein [Promethearchaeota archaeon]|nr:MAG: NAD-dependent epimerase/dehydratase family protein [Candidatus Lokiarchaeota archaeon]
MIKNRNILITGGAGFIGSNLFEELVKYNNYISVIDNFNEYYKGKEQQFDKLTEGLNGNQDFKLIKGDLLQDTTYEQIENDIDIIFHLAAQPGVRYSIENPTEISHNNITSTIKIFEYAIKKKISKVIYASSSSVYGNPLYTPVNEEHPKNPISPYAVSKLTGEIYADYYYREYGLPVISHRFYTVYGPRGRPDMAIRKFFEKISHNEEILIYGDGEQLRDFTYISDIINGLILSSEERDCDGEIFNLGCSNPISVNQLVDKIYNIANKPKKVRYVGKKKGDVDITHSDITKAKKILKYYPKIDIYEGLKKTYNWLIESTNKN